MSTHRRHRGLLLLLVISLAFMMSSSTAFRLHQGPLSSQNRWSRPSNDHFQRPYDSLFSTAASNTPIDLPLKTIDKNLYSGRWTITSSNELQDSLGGFLTVEIVDTGFTAIRHTGR